jgi:hypothetical protein
MIRVPLQELLDLKEVMLFSKLHSLIPLVQKHTAINSLLNISTLHIALDRKLRDAKRHEFISEFVEDGSILWENLD